MPRAFKFIPVLICLVSAGLSAQPILSERLTAETKHSYYRDVAGLHVTREDSIVYFYSGARNSVYDYNRLCYNCISALGTLDPDYTTILPAPNNLDPALRPNVQYDSLYRRGPEGSGSFPERWTQVIRYNPDNSPAELSRFAFAQQSPDTQATNHTTIAYTAGRMSRVESVFNSPGWPAPYTAALRFLQYNAAGLVTLDSLSDRYFVYSYDSKGRYTARNTYEIAGWTATMTGTDSVTYDTAGRVVLHFHRERSRSSFPESYNDSFGYTPQVPGFTSRHRQYVEANGNPLDIFSVTTANRINALNRIDSMTTYSGGAGDLRFESSLKLDYNANANPVRKTEWIAYVAEPVYISRYTYAPYIIPDTPKPTGISTITNLMSVYPNPTSGILNLQWKDGPAGLDLQAAIADPTGRLLRTENVRLQDGQAVLQSGESLPAGMYFLQIVDPKGASLYSGKLERR